MAWTYPGEKLLRQEVLSGPLIHADETPFQVLFEDGREAKDKSYMWLLCGGPPDAGVVYHKYAPSRGRAVVEELLDSYQGYVVTDGKAQKPRPAPSFTVSLKRRKPTIWSPTATLSSSSRSSHSLKTKKILKIFCPCTLTPVK